MKSHFLSPMGVILYLWIAWICDASAHGHYGWVMDNPATAHCCGPQDCKPVSPGEVRFQRGRWFVNGKPVPIYGDGRNIRDWLHVEDHCRGIDAVLSRGEIGHTYNIGGDCELANIDLVQSLCEVVDGLFTAHAAYVEQYSSAPPALGGKCSDLITYVDDRLGHDRRYAIDATKMKRELGFSPEMNFDQALSETAKWYLDNPDWWRPILDDSYRVDISC